MRSKVRIVSKGKCSILDKAKHIDVKILCVHVLLRYHSKLKIVCSDIRVQEKAVLDYHYGSQILCVTYRHHNNTRIYFQLKF